MGSLFPVVKLGRAFRPLGAIGDRALRLFPAADNADCSGASGPPRGRFAAPAKAEKIWPGPGLGRLVFESGTALDTTAASTLRILVENFGQGLSERLYQFNLDTNAHYLSDQTIARGNLTQLLSSYRPIIASALEASASRIVLVHNHPSGNALPSQADRLITKHIAAVLRAVEVVLQDHVIVTRSQAYSMRMAGLL